MMWYRQSLSNHGTHCGHLRRVVGCSPPAGWSSLHSERDVPVAQLCPENRDPGQGTGSSSGALALRVD